MDEKIVLMEELIEGGIEPATMMPRTGYCALPDSIRLTRRTVKLGVGGTLMLPPFFYKCVSMKGFFAITLKSSNRLAYLMI
ncbi:hypothetical protein [Octadecabacter antarcticus]|uniref:hypothetical protein n=1 Tax=Octadecabacter antarcticus TaxID=1217908 RepID=UPI001FE17DB2|nr:hypothetical protein [Octadecabacter antarcticus]